MDLVQLFKGVSDPVRLRIVHLLLQKDELCVCHIIDALSLPQSTISRHLNTLKQNGLIASEQRGKWVFYRLCNDDEQVAMMTEIIRQSAISDGQLQKDADNLKQTSC